MVDTFHGFRVAFLSGMGQAPDLTDPELWRPIPERLLAARIPQVALFEALVVDEGHDFEAEWLEVLRLFLTHDADVRWLEDPDPTLQGRPPVALPGFVGYRCPTDCRPPQSIARFVHNTRHALPFIVEPGDAAPGPGGVPRHPCERPFPGDLIVDRTERFYRIDQLLQERLAVPLEAMIEALGVSRATVVRDLEYLRDRLAAPIVWDRERRGYRYETRGKGGPRYALPGLWLNASEVHALLTMEQLLANLQPGLLGPHIEPLRARIRMLMDTGEHAVADVARRIRLLHLGARPVEPGQFPIIADALLARRRLHVRHHNRKTGETLERELSPQRLVYYRDNWYLDAWCHLREGLRSFSLDAFERVEALEHRAKDVAEKTLNAQLGAGYGIFGGTPTHTAVLRFSPERARWVARERWHPEQKGEFDAQGYYVLSVPYADATELVMDVLRHGPEVEVLAPAELRSAVRERLRQARAVYGD